MNVGLLCAMCFIMLITLPVRATESGSGEHMVVVEKLLFGFTVNIGTYFASGVFKK